MPKPHERNKLELKRQLAEAEAEDLAKLIAYYQDGHTVRACAIKFDLPLGTAYYRIRNSGTPMRKRSRSEPDDHWEEWKKLNQTGA